jgi:hypothetical protein
MSNGTYYEFDGSSGCDLCQAVTGIYDDEPPLPHNHCDCDIYEVVEADIYDSTDNDSREIEIVVDSRSKSTSEYTEFGWHTESFHNQSPLQQEFTYSWSDSVPYGVGSLPEEIEEHFDLSDELSSLDISVDTTFELDPDQEAEIGVHLVVKITEIELRLHYVDTLTNEVVDSRTFEAYIVTPIRNGWSINKS